LRSLRGFGLHWRLLVLWLERPICGELSDV